MLVTRPFAPLSPYRGSLDHSFSMHRLMACWTQLQVPFTPALEAGQVVLICTGRSHQPHNILVWYQLVLQDCCTLVWLFVLAVQAYPEHVCKLT